MFHFDSQGQRIEGDLAGHYVLEQHIQDPTIEGRRWRLTELNGQPLDLDDLQTQPFLISDGGDMTLNRARMASLARFVEVQQSD